MKATTPPRRGTTYIGIDFSGARDAGKRIWIATGTCASKHLTIESLFSLRERPDPYSYLVKYIASQTHAVIGIDVPFSLHRSLMDRGWAQFVDGFEKRFHTADQFREWCQRMTSSELRRDTDISARTPFCPWNLRLYRQTWAALAYVIGPIVQRDAGRFAPLQEVSKKLPVIVEVCPASSLKATAGQGSVPSYKKRTELHRRARRALLSNEAGVKLAPELNKIVVDDHGGDALDSIIAASSAARAERLGLIARRDSYDNVEGRVYFERTLPIADQTA